MKNKLWAKGIVIGIIVLFFGASVVPFIKADPIAWDVTLYFINPGGQNDYVMFGEVPDARDGPPADSYDVVKPPAPMVPYIRAYLKDNLPTPYTNLWKDYRYYPDSAKVWNLSVKWEPVDGESPTTITMSWSTAEVHDSEYTNVSLCTNAGVFLKNMLINNTYTFGCPASVLQNFKIICSVSGNQPPVANPDSYSTNEDTLLTVTAPGVLGNDNDPDGDSITAVKVSDPSHGMVALNSNGGFTYMPATNYNGPDSFTYRAFDGTVNSNNATVSITVTAMNDPPVVTDIPDQTIAEGLTFATINLDDFVTDVDNTDAQMVWTYSGNIDLTVSIDSGRVATITIPNADWNGQETITFRANDPGSLYGEDSAVFTVTAVNDPPVVSGIPDQTIAEGSTFATISLDNYVSDVDNTDAEMTWTYSGNVQLTVSIVARVATITIPNLDWNGAETITFTATDTGALSDSDDATFTVTTGNDPPVVGDIPDQTIAEGSSFATIGLDDYVTDVEDPDSAISWTASAASYLSVSIDAVTHVATITVLDVNWNGDETITFIATDTGALSGSDDVKFTVTAVNNPPVVTDIPDQTIAEGSTFATISLDNYVSDVDNTDAQMVWTYSGNVQLTVSIVARVATITISNLDWNGAETITFTATDTGALSDSDDATFTVTTGNDPPVVSDIPDQTIAEGSSFATISLDNYVSDPDNTDAQMVWTYSGNVQLTVSIVARVATITIPNLDWNGAETITFIATDPGSLWDDDPVTFTVTVVNDPLVFGTPSPGNGSTGNLLSFSWSIPISDPEGDSFNWVIQCSNGQSANANGASNGTKALSLSGLAYLTTYKVWVNATDPTGSGLWTRRWYTFTTKRVNNPPVFGTPSPGNGSTGNLLSFTWSIPINDPNGDLFSWTIQCSNGQINSGTGASNGIKSLVLSGLAYSTTYKVWVNATDPTGSGLYTRKWYGFTTAEEPNSPPAIPQRPSGTASGKINVEYTYTTITTDPNHDQIYYNWSWGDGTTSGWLGPYPSNQTVQAKHTWTKKGNYGIKVKAKDIHGAESNWSESLPITMPVSQHYILSEIGALIHFIIRFFRGEFAGMTFIQILRIEGWFL